MEKGNRHVFTAGVAGRTCWCTIIIHLGKSIIFRALVSVEVSRELLRYSILQEKEEEKKKRVHSMHVCFLDPLKLKQMVSFV